jgi:hypothetical protein
VTLARAVPMFWKAISALTSAVPTGFVEGLLFDRARLSACDPKR